MPPHCQALSLWAGERLRRLLLSFGHISFSKPYPLISLSLMSCTKRTVEMAPARIDNFAAAASGDFNGLLEDLTIQEKIAFLAGANFWETAAVDRLGILSLKACPRFWLVLHHTNVILSSVTAPTERAVEPFLRNYCSMLSSLCINCGNIQQSSCLPHWQGSRSRNSDKRSICIARSNSMWSQITSWKAQF